jgi:hypothetical protein
MTRLRELRYVSEFLVSCIVAALLGTLLGMLLDDQIRIVWPL